MLDRALRQALAAATPLRMRTAVMKLVPRHGGFAEAEVADAGKDVTVEVVAVEPGGVW